jgi:hypothetical protein
MIYGDNMPYLVRGFENDWKKLFYSRPEQALILPVTLAPGYGILRAGTALALNVSAAGNLNKYVPYAPTTPTVGNSDVDKAVARLVNGDQLAATSVYVSLADSYKFVVGDDVIIYDGNTTTTGAGNLGAITAIDRTTYTNMAVLTVTSAPSGSTFTAAQGACIHVECGADNSNGYSDAAGILIATVDTGIGENAVGALAAMVISNAILYTGMLTNVDAAARTDLSIVTKAGYTILK